MVSRQRVSEELSPRDGVRPPLQELVEAFITLYVERTGDDHGRIRREINELYRAADQTAEEVKARRRDVAEAAGLRHPTPAELQDQRDKARGDLNKAEAERRQVQARHDEIVATVARTNENQAQQIQALHAEQAELQQRLHSQDAEMTRLREQFEEMSRRAGRARAEADRALAEAASTRPDLDQNGVDRTFSQVTSLAAPGQLTTSTPDTADGVRQDRDPDKSHMTPADVRITPETSNDRKQWNQQRQHLLNNHKYDWRECVCALMGGCCLAGLSAQVLGSGGHWALALTFLLFGILLMLSGFHGLRRSFHVLPADLQVHPIDGRWQVVSGPRPNRGDYAFEWNNPDRTTPIKLAFKVLPRYDERPVSARGTLYLNTPTELLHGRYVSVRWMLREGSSTVASGHLRVHSGSLHRDRYANLETVELPPSKSPGPYTLQLERTDGDCAEISVIWRDHGVLARRWHRWHRVSLPKRPEEATADVHDYQQQNPDTEAAGQQPELGVQGSRSV